jgi:hypothetical protein
MARSLDGRLARLEAQHAASQRTILEEARTFFRLPLAGQLAEIDQAEADLRQAGFTDADLAHVRATLTRYYRPMDA